MSWVSKQNLKKKNKKSANDKYKQYIRNIKTKLKSAERRDFIMLSEEMDLSMVKQEEPVDYIFTLDPISVKAEEDFQSFDKQKNIGDGLVEVVKQEPESDDETDGVSELGIDEKAPSGPRMLNQNTRNTQSRKPQNHLSTRLQCSETDDTKEGLLDHMKTRSSENMEMERCEICKRSFRKDNMPFHIRKHKGLVPYFCTLCTKTFSSRSNWREHKLKHEGRRFKCDICKKLFIRKGSLTEHLQVHFTREKKFECAICSISYLRQSSLNRHNRRRHTQKLYKRIDNLADNQKSVKLTLELEDDNENEKSTGSNDKNCFECDICSRVYWSKDMLIIHFSQFHQIVELGNFPCSLCNNIFASAVSLMNHVKGSNHDLLKLMPVTKSYSKREVGKHREQRRFECKICFQSFNSKRGLVFHTANNCRLETIAIKAEKM